MCKQSRKLWPQSVAFYQRIKAKRKQNNRASLGLSWPQSSPRYRSFLNFVIHESRGTRVVLPCIVKPGNQTINHRRLVILSGNMKLNNSRGRKAAKVPLTSGRRFNDLVFWKWSRSVHRTDRIKTGYAATIHRIILIRPSTKTNSDITQVFVVMLAHMSPLQCVP